MRRTVDPRGFTLIETMLAAVLAGIVIVTISLLLRQVELTRTAVARTSLSADVPRNGAHLLRSLLEQVDVTSDSARQFTGDRSSVSMPTVCQTGGGWAEPCDVTLALDRRADSTIVVAQWLNGNSLMLDRFANPRSFIFLESFEERRWISVWGRGSLPPLAVGLVDQLGDTLVFFIGDRS